MSCGAIVGKQNGRPSDPLEELRTPKRPEEDNSREAAMVGRLIQVTKSAYQYPLIFKQLWHTPSVQAPDQEVVYRDLKRFTYLQIRERIGRCTRLPTIIRFIMSNG